MIEFVNNLLQTQATFLQTTLSKSSLGMPTDGFVLRIAFGFFLLRRRFSSREGKTRRQVFPLPKMSFFLSFSVGKRNSLTPYGGRAYGQK